MEISASPPTPAELAEIGFTQDEINPNLFTRHDGVFEFYPNTTLGKTDAWQKSDFATKVLKEIDELRKSKI